MATPGKSVLLDTSVVVRHFRDGTALVQKLAAYEELYLPQAALAELYAGAYRSARPEKHIEQIERFLEAVDVLIPDELTSEGYGRVSAVGACRDTHPAERHLDRGASAATRSPRGHFGSSFPARQRPHRSPVVMDPGRS